MLVSLIQSSYKILKPYNKRAGPAIDVQNGHNIRMLLIYLDLELSKEWASLPVIPVVKSKEDPGNLKRISPKGMNNERCNLQFAIAIAKSIWHIFFLKNFSCVQFKLVMNDKEEFLEDRHNHY